jgi:hypothetical protein
MSRKPRKGKERRQMKKHRSRANRKRASPEKKSTGNNQEDMLMGIPRGNKTPEMCLAAVKKYGLSLRAIPLALMTAEMCLEAVKQNGLAIRYVPVPFKTAELERIAVGQNWMALHFVYQTRELCLLALGQCEKAVDYIWNPWPEILLSTGRITQEEFDYREALDEAREFYYSHIGLFYANRDRILQDPRFYSIEPPDVLFSTAYVSFRGARVTLGELVELWQNEPRFSTPCDCGGSGLLYFYGGSPLSGTCDRTFRCTVCGKTLRKRDCFLGETRKEREKYQPRQPLSENPATMHELVDFCEGRAQAPSTYIDDGFHSIPAPGGAVFRRDRHEVALERAIKREMNRK